LSLLRERVAPVKKNKPRPDDSPDIVRRLSVALIKPIKHKIKDPIPPLKYLPEEIDSDDSNYSYIDGERTKELEKSYLLYKRDFDRIDRKIYLHM